MALFRNVNMSFWTDTKVTDDFTPEDKYFMIYALTNPYTNIIGCYEVSIKQIGNDLGYTRDVVENLLKRFSNVHKTVFYDFDTKELFVKNWNKYNWSDSPKLDIPLYNAIEKVKSDKFHDELAVLYNNRKSVIERKAEGNEDMVWIPYRYPMDTTISISNTIPISISNSISISDSIPNTIEDASNSKTSIPYQAIVDYLNIRTGAHYKASTKKTRDLIKARFNEGFTFEDFQVVIDNKCSEWIKDKEMNKYLRPETLFGNKFESYLNQPRRILTTADIPMDMSDVRKVMWND